MLSMFGDSRKAARKSPLPVHPLLIAAGAAVATGLLVRAGVRRSRFFDLRDKVCLVTGGSRGLGYVLARQLLARGAHVAICARDEAELRGAQNSLSTGGGSVLAITCDVTDPEDIERMLGQMHDVLGPVDVLINNAGIITVGPVEEQTIRDYDEAINTHFQGPVHLTLGVLPEMQRRRSGRIVNITSIGGKVPTPHLVPYAASKYALVGFSESLRTEVAKDNVYVTTVVPGLMRTGSPPHAMFKGQDDKEYAWFSTADHLPIISIDVERQASRIIDALQHGDAELITPFVANLQAKVHGLFPNLTTELASLFNRLLPGPGGIGQRRNKGFESRAKLRR